LYMEGYPGFGWHSERSAAGTSCPECLAAVTDRTPLCPRCERPLKAPTTKLRKRGGRRRFGRRAKLIALIYFVTAVAVVVTIIELGHQAVAAARSSAAVPVERLTR
jgi:hypothetical protein